MSQSRRSPSVVQSQNEKRTAPGWIVSQMPVNNNTDVSDESELIGIQVLQEMAARAPRPAYNNVTPQKASGRVLETVASLPPSQPHADKTEKSKLRLIAARNLTAHHDEEGAVTLLRLVSPAEHPAAMYELLEYALLHRLDMISSFIIGSQISLDAVLRHIIANQGIRAFRQALASLVRLDKLPSQAIMRRVLKGKGDAAWQAYVETLPQGERDKAAVLAVQRQDYFVLVRLVRAGLSDLDSIVRLAVDVDSDYGRISTEYPGVFAILLGAPNCRIPRADFEEFVKKAPGFADMAQLGVYQPATN